MTHEALRLDRLRVNLRKTEILHEVGFSVFAGEVLGVVGPNGCGKTTALRCCYQALRPSAGAILLEGKPIATMPRRRVARRIAASTQEPSQLGGLTVRESVALGRAPHHGWLERQDATDQEIVSEALARLDLEHLEARDAAELSGGERQRVSIARALAQRARVLLLDEPTNHLDLRHQLRLLDLLRTLADEGLAVVLTIHDLRSAVEYCDRLVLLDQGRVVAEGSCDEVLTPQRLATVFGVAASVLPADGGRYRIDVTGLVE